MTPTLESIMLQKSIGSMERHRSTCSRCKRTPLVGEYMHSVERHKPICGLCLARLPESDRAEVRSERVGAAERALPVAPRAA